MEVRRIDWSVRAVAAGGLFFLSWLAAYAASVWNCNDLISILLLPALGAVGIGMLCDGRLCGVQWLTAMILGMAFTTLSICAGVPWLLLNWRSPGYGNLSAGCGFGLMMVSLSHWLVAALGGGATTVICWMTRRYRQGAEQSAEEEETPC